MIVSQIKFFCNNNVTKLKFRRRLLYSLLYIVYYLTLRYCRGAAHATSRRVALHHPASGTLLLYKQRRSSVLWLGSHSSTRVTSKHGQPTCTDVLASTSLRRGQRRHLEACSIGGRRTAWWPASLVDRCTARKPAAQVDGTASAVGRYNWRTGGRLSHGTGLCTILSLIHISEPTRPY